MGKHMKLTEQQSSTFIRLVNSLMERTKSATTAVSVALDTFTNDITPDSPTQPKTAKGGGGIFDKDRHMENETYTPPKQAQENAKKVLKWREEHGDDVKGMTDVGWDRAKQLASGDAVSREVVSKISQFKRHKDNSKVSEEHKDEPWKDAGHVAWLGWGGDAAILDWAPEVLEGLKNASQKPTVLYCRHMQSGLVRYMRDGAEKIYLVELDAMKRMAETMKGCFVYVQHQESDYDHEKSDGVVSDCFYNPDDGWLWAKFTVYTDEGHEAVAKGWSVSNAYTPTEFGTGGTKNDCPYEKEILNGVFDHLALVPNPRYEKAKIFTEEQYKDYMAELREESKLENSSDNKQQESEMEMSFFKRTKVTSLEGENLKDIEVKVGDKFLNVSDMAETVEKYEKEKEVKENADADKDMKEIMSAKVKVNGKEYTVEELKNRCEEIMSKKENSEEEDEDKKSNAEDEDEKMENAKGKAEAETLRNHFNSLEDDEDDDVLVLENSRSMAERGAQRYGSNKK